MRNAIAIVAGSALLLLGFYITVADAHPPPALKTQAGIERVYPDLYARELSRAPEHSWTRLRRMASTRWHRQHPCAEDTLAHADYWAAVEVTWSCIGTPSWKRAFLRCIPRHEGGYTHPDVRYGGRTGYAGLKASGNIVLGPWQVRPGWVNGFRRTGRVVYGRDRWSWEAYQDAVNPVFMAKLVSGIAPSQYATKSRCGQ